MAKPTNFQTELRMLKVVLREFIIELLDEYGIEYIENIEDVWDL